MSKPTNHGHLILLKESPNTNTPTPKEPIQGVLFPDLNRLVVYLLHMPALSDDLFLETVRSARPSLVFDLRPVPSFSFGRLNRHIVFDFFESEGISYVDVPGIVGAASRRDAKLKAGAMSETIVTRIKNTEGDPSRVMILLDDGTAVHEAASDLPKRLPARNKESWQVRVVGGIRCTQGSP